jgi:ribonuclease HI
VWWKESFLGEDKTNNYAEHSALADGVQECVRRYQGLEIRLHVIGDSRLVLQQAVDQAKTTNRSLRCILATTAPATRWRISSRTER